MVNEEPNRAERRRQEKEQGKWNEAEWGKLAFRVFDKCPGCGCPARFSVEGMRGEMPEELMKAKPPALGALEFKYDTALYRITLAVVVDSCCKCGMIYTIARSKTKMPLVMIPKGGDGPGLIHRAG